MGHLSARGEKNFHNYFSKKIFLSQQFFFQKNFFVFKSIIFIFKNFFQTKAFFKKSFTLIKKLKSSKLFNSHLVRKTVRIESAGKEAVIGMKIINKRATFAFNL